MKHIYFLFLLLTAISFGQVSNTQNSDVKHNGTSLLSQSSDTNSVKIYPNPVKGNLLYIDVRSEAQIEIFDVLGKRVSNTKLGFTSRYLSISTLKKGIYIIRVKTNSGITSKKLIRQ